MDPLPPGDLTTPPAPAAARGWVDKVLDSRGAAVFLSLFLFALSFIRNTWQDERQREQIQRGADESERMRVKMEQQGEDLRAVRAMLEQQQKRK